MSIALLIRPGQVCFAQAESLAWLNSPLFGMWLFFQVGHFFVIPAIFVMWVFNVVFFVAWVFVIPAYIGHPILEPSFMARWLAAGFCKGQWSALDADPSPGMTKVCLTLTFMTST